MGVEPTNNGFANRNTKQGELTQAAGNTTVTKTDESEKQKSCAQLVFSEGFDADLRQVVERWPVLPDNVKAAIKALVK